MKKPLANLIFRAISSGAGIQYYNVNTGNNMASASGTAEFIFEPVDRHYESC